ncbi:hypothetical protein WAC45_27350, partial [Klebsiella pneumoniae]|uniref:hypothetical protein n=1 Tax=Klebsiella pneumoniae TaxID=573 RepID=UPI0030130DED
HQNVFAAFDAGLIKNHQYRTSSVHLGGACTILKLISKKIVANLWFHAKRQVCLAERTWHGSC